MYILFLDESGDPNSWATGQQYNFVIGGVALFEGAIREVTERLNGIQHRFFPDIGIPIAFHASDIRSGKGIFRRIDAQQRVLLLSEVYNAIGACRFPDVVVFSTCMHITAVSDADQALRDTFEDICQRFNTFLWRQHRAGHTNKGLLIIDQAHEDRYRRLLAEFQTAGTRYGYLGNVVDVPYFGKRQDTRMLQLAGFCASAVFQYYEHGDRESIDAILPRFDRRAPLFPYPDGLGHITRHECSCEACSRRAGA